MPAPEAEPPAAAWAPPPAPPASPAGAVAPAGPAAHRLVVDQQERQRILDLATDFPAVWHDPDTPVRERKRLLALVIDDVTVLKQRQIAADTDRLVQQQTLMDAFTPGLPNDGSEVRLISAPTRTIRTASVACSARSTAIHTLRARAPGPVTAPTSVGSSVSG